MSEDDRGLVGQVVGDKYRILSRLGGGGMGEVYAAEHVAIHRRLAVKFLRPELHENSEFLERFRREAQTAGRIENKHVAAVIDFGTTSDETPFIVMEYLDGQVLADLISNCSPLPVPRVIRIVLQVCQGVAAAHAHDVVHRDLKPDNIFICPQEDGSDLAKILDFGIVKLSCPDQAESITRTGSMLGTPSYMSPEQAEGRKDVSEATDIYALGVILYEALTNKKPHPGANYNAIIYHILKKQPEPIQTHRPAIPRELAEVISRAMEYEPQRRYSSVVDLRNALAPFADLQESHVDETREANSTLASRDTQGDGFIASNRGSQPSSSSLPGSSPFPRPPSRHVLWGIGGIVAALLVVCLVIWSAIRTNHTSLAHSVSSISEGSSSQVTSASPVEPPALSAIESVPSPPSSAPTASSNKPWPAKPKTKGKFITEGYQ